MKTKLILGLLGIWICSCTELRNKSDHEKVETFLKVKIADNSEVHFRLIRHNIDYVLPYVCFMKIKCNEVDYQRIGSVFEVVNLDSLRKTQLYSELNSNGIFNLRPFETSLDSNLVEDVDKEIKSHTLDWWDLGKKISGTTKSAFIDVKNEKFILPIKTVCKSPECTIGKLMMEYYNGYCYIVATNL